VSLPKSFHCLRRRRERGIALIEFALIAPLLLLILFSAIEYGWMFIKVQQLGQAARIGARLGITQAATTAWAKGQVDAYLATTGLDAKGCTVTFSPADVSTMVPGSLLEVTVSVPCANVELTGFPLPKPTTLVSFTTMAKEGPPP
jgi:Flp pilus assembly protein TadG